MYMCPRSVRQPAPPGAGEDDARGRLVGGGLCEGIDQSGAHRVVLGVHRRIVDGDDGKLAFAAQLDDGHGRCSYWGSLNRGAS